MKLITLQNADLRWHEDSKDIFVVDVSRPSRRKFTDNQGATGGTYREHFSDGERAAYLLAAAISAHLNAGIPLHKALKALQCVESFSTLFDITDVI